jgi:type I restriction enzyme M protein
VPPKKNADWAWVQHMYKSMDNKKGRIAVVLPQGSLFRSGAEGRIRQSFLEEDLIECVIGMAPNLFYGTGLSPCIITLRANKRKEGINNVLIINSESLFKRGRNQNTLEDSHISAILKLYDNFESVEGLSHLASSADIKKNNYNLNIPLYVDQANNGDVITIEQHLENLGAMISEVQDSRNSLRDELMKWGMRVSK